MRYSYQLYNNTYMIKQRIKMQEYEDILLWIVSHFYIQFQSSSVLP